MEFRLLEAARGELAESTVRWEQAHLELVQAPGETSPEFPDKSRLWDVYMGKDKTRTHTIIQVTITKEHVDSLQFSINAAAASLLQYARQGISIVFGGPNDLSGGRSVAGQHLPLIVFAARNQALHWEEGPATGFNRQVMECFNSLAKSYPAMADFAKRNVAFDVVQMLGWRSNSDFEADLCSLRSVRPLP